MDATPLTASCQSWLLLQHTDTARRVTLLYVRRLQYVPGLYRRLQYVAGVYCKLYLALAAYVAGLCPAVPKASAACGALQQLGAGVGSCCSTVVLNMPTCCFLRACAPVETKSLHMH
jgi:hypothetical protein